MKKVFLAIMITAMFVFTSVLAGATDVTLGTMTGSGSATLTAEFGQPTNYSFSGGFHFDTTDLGGGNSFKTIFGDQGQFTFAANKAGSLTAWDSMYPGTTQSINKGNFQWILDNVGPPSATIYGRIASFTFTPASIGPTGTVTGTLITDGNIHWYYGFDDTVGPPRGMTPLADLHVSDNLYFNGTYSITPGQDYGTILNYTLAGTVTGRTVPEPATMLLLGLGLMGIAGIRRKLRS